MTDRFNREPTALPAAPIPDLKGWEPVDGHDRDVVTPAVAAAMHGLLDTTGPPPSVGQALPPLWHWLAFLPRVAQELIGADGHPRRGGFLPPVTLPRRMFVGGEVVRSDPGALRVGQALRRSGRVEEVEAKSGRTGELVFVTVGYRVSPDGEGTAAGAARAGSGGAGLGAGVSVSPMGPGPGLVETQRLVYRAAPSHPAPAPPVGTPPPASPSGDAPGVGDRRWTMGLDLRVEPTILFRFSALTYNAHRIHYDRAWAMEREGYPGLVVHGPLQAMALAELCRRHQPGRVVRAFSFRALAPAFDDGPLLARGWVDDSGEKAELAAFDHRGRRTMTATATLG